jgi:hypothetical protein
VAGDIWRVAGHKGHERCRKHRFFSGGDMILLSLTVSASVRQYLRAYEHYAADFWNNMTPMQYGMILIFIAIGGYLLMRSSR